MVLAAAHHSKARNQNWSVQCQYNMTGWKSMLCLGRDI